MQITRKQELALWLSGLIGFAFPFKFAYDIYHNVFVANIVTWLLVLILDVVGLLIAVKEGNKRPYLQLGWAIAAVCIMLAILVRQSTFAIGWVEIASSLLCLLAVILWRTAGQHAAILGFTFQTLAVYVSFIPQAVNYWIKPEPSTWYLWFFTAIGCALAIYASPKKDMRHTFIPWGAFILNVAIMMLVLR